eukprot:1244049-Amphidinium_carterae.1
MSRTLLHKHNAKHEALFSRVLEKLLLTNDVFHRHLLSLISLRDASPRRRCARLGKQSLGVGALRIHWVLA